MSPRARSGAPVGSGVRCRKDSLLVSLQGASHTDAIKKSWLAKVIHFWRAFSPLTKPRRKPRFRPLLELLEDRSVPATITVTTASDTLVQWASHSHREAILSIDQGADLNQDVTANRVGNFTAPTTMIIFNIANGNQAIAINNKQFSAYVPISGESSLAAVGGIVWNDLNQNGQARRGRTGHQRRHRELVRRQQ